MKPFFVLLLPFVLVLCGPVPAPAQESLPKAQADAVAEIKKLGGNVTLDAKSGEVAKVAFHSNITDAGLVHLKGLTSLRSLILRGPQITDAGLEHLKGLPSLRYLHIGGTQITDAGLVQLKGLTVLTTLYLNNTQVTDAGLVHLKGLTSLTELQLDHTQITDAGLKNLKELTSLTGLSLTDTQVTDAGLEHLKGLTRLNILYLNGTQITDAGLEHLKGLPILNILSLTDTPITDVGLVHLKGLTSLTRLYLDHTQVTDAGLEHLKGLTSLISLDLNGTRITGAGLKHLKGLSRVRALLLSGTQFTDAGLVHLTGLTQLTSLTLSGEQITDSGLTHLKGLSNLTKLTLVKTQVTDAGLTNIREALPYCRVNGTAARNRPPMAPTAQKRPNAEWGTITGNVVLKGDVPERVLQWEKGASIKDAKVCSAEESYRNDLVIDEETKGISNVFVYLSKAPTDIHPDFNPAPKIIYNIQKCQFKPHALVVRTGQTVEVINSDTIPYGIHTYPLRNNNHHHLIRSDTKQGDGIAIVSKRSERQPYSVRCDYHSWMKAYWLVLDHPYAVATDAKGNFKIENVPVGEHKFHIWHERAGYIDKEYTVNVALGENPPLVPIEMELSRFEAKNRRF
ncbi:MAG: leucine-rich repeat domain-containing protein [Fuerstiella sp.]